MGCKMTSAITWTQLELKGLLEDEESHVHFERAKRHLGLHPFHLTDLNAALREILTASINSYDARVQGIILSYKNPKLLSRMGTILYDTCFIHIDIEADFYVFKPNVGDTLKGIINKKSQGHVGILVHKTFNATIHKPHDDTDWPGHSIRIGQEVRFTVTYLEIKNRLPYIRGTLDQQDYLRGCQIFDDNFGGTKKVDVKPKISKFSYDDDDDESNVVQEISVADVDHSTEDDDVKDEVSRKKLKKVKRENTDDDGDHVKIKKKHKVKAEVTVLEDEADSHEQNQSCVEDAGNLKEEFLPGKLKFKREISGDKIAAKKKKKNKVKAEQVLSETEYEEKVQSHRYIQEPNEVTDEEFLPKKVKKVKKESKIKTKLEVEIINEEGDSDLYRVNGNRKIKSESDAEKSRTKHKVKTEIFSSETDSDVKVKSKKRIKVDSNNENSRKKHKVKAEVFSSETESFMTEGNQSITNEHETTGEKIRKKHRIKAELSMPDTNN